MSESAVEHLRNNQGQADEEGIIVTVSRQALGVSGRRGEAMKNRKRLLQLANRAKNRQGQNLHILETSDLLLEEVNPFLDVIEDLEEIIQLLEQEEA